MGDQLFHLLMESAALGNSIWEIREELNLAKSLEDEQEIVIEEQKWLRGHIEFYMDRIQAPKKRVQEERARELMMPFKWLTDVWNWVATSQDLTGSTCNNDRNRESRPLLLDQPTAKEQWKDGEVNNKRYF
ncbi:hypothetical protein HDU76_006558 [Blyttiomyces sp. JEL0837]|nr:hypothetical protein HDU76_006558 [Blyttiomyces sp. JEL0837]